MVTPWRVPVQRRLPIRLIHFAGGGILPIHPISTGFEEDEAFSPSSGFELEEAFGPSTYAPTAGSNPPARFNQPPTVGNGAASHMRDLIHHLAGYKLCDS